MENAASNYINCPLLYIDFHCRLSRGILVMIWYVI